MNANIKEILHMCRHERHKELKRKGRQVMGMAASQARFLGLTARKTNVEFEGQQINQQRTTLSNQSANYYNQLLGMSVPVPPSVDDYTKTVYTFEDGALSNSISTMIAQKGGEYLISYTSSWTDDFAAVAAGQSIVSKNQNPKDTNNAINGTLYSVGAKELRKMGDAFILDKCDANGNVTNTAAAYMKKGKYYSDEKCTKEIKDPDKQSFKLNKNYNDEYLKSLSLDQLEKLQTEENEYINILNKQYAPDGKESWMVRYVQNTSTGTWSPFFNKKSVLDSAIYSDTGSSQSNIPAYTIGSAKKTEEVKGVTARLEQDSTGRIINVTLHPGKADEVTYAVTTNTLTDQAKYNDAMNQYEYDKYQYDQSIQEINSKIEIIQSEDKNLELRLKQLDTEQKAIQTEMESVQKVIEKNTESTFKTFG